MMRFRISSSLVLSSFLLFSCSIKKNIPHNSSVQAAKTTETVGLDEDDIFEKTPKTGEYLHELAEADADDLSIKQAVGVSEIDEDLAAQTENEVPYAPRFLKARNTKRVQFWVDYFTRAQRERFQRFINNGEEYRHHIEDIFVQAGLPKELYFVGLIESGYYLGARSHAAAVGPWQFIKGTGKRYGLKFNHELDERQDLFKATRAAAAYFRDLHNIFSSWELSLAAYNAGEYGMIRRILKFGTRDFYSLSRNKQLPSETINYVPKVLAAMHVVNNAEKYGFVIPKKSQKLFDLTELRPIKKNIPLRSVASRLNVDETLLKRLNPELRRNSTPRTFAGTYFLRIPKSKYSYRLEDVDVDGVAAHRSRPETRKELNRRIAASAEEKMLPPGPKFHRVNRGDTIFAIAKRYGTSPLTIASANNMKSGRERLRPGSRISLIDNTNRLENERVQIIEKAESVPAVVKVAVVTEKAEVQRINFRQAAMKVKITKGPLYYKVSRGDSLKNLARLFNVKVKELSAANKLRRGKITPGQKIVLPDTHKGIYTVKHGDHLYKVARDLNRPVEVLVKLNDMKRKTIYPGQKIIVNMD
jgi:membrane-bound lytic murein transglycosylase D